VADSTLRRSVATIAIVVVVVAAAAVAFVYSGTYDIGADAPHSKFVFSALDELRDRSIAAHAGKVVAPADLNSPKRIEAGAGLYAEMCTGCHLAPGMEPTEISQGLYPPAPALAKGSDLTAAEEFWVIKHGVKLTAMPAWGKTHDDDLIWDMVAFIRRLPDMNPQQYKTAVAQAPADHDEMMEEMHRH
jgi:mono/diheme cytochrome c family protein